MEARDRAWPLANGALDATHGTLTTLDPLENSTQHGARRSQSIGCRRTDVDPKNDARALREEPAIRSFKRPSNLPRPASGAVLRSDVAAEMAERALTPRPFPARSPRDTSPLAPRHLRLATQREAVLPPLLAGAIRAALASAGGELEVGEGANVARLFFTRGAIAWIAAPGGVKLPTLLRVRAGVSGDALRSVVAESKRSGRSFVDLLVESGVVGRDALRAIVLEHNARQLAAILDLDSLHQVQFRPTSRAYVGGLTFTLEETLAALAQARDEVLEPGPSTSVTPVVTAPAVVRTGEATDASLARLMETTGAIAAALVDSESGSVLGSVRGRADFDVDLAARGNVAVVAAKLAVMRALGLPGGIEDMLTSVPAQYHLVRPLAKAPSTFLYLVIDRETGNLGLARHALRLVDESLGL